MQFKADEGRSRKILERSKVEIMEKTIKNRVHQNSDASGNNLRNSSVDADTGSVVLADTAAVKQCVSLSFIINISIFL